MGLFRRLFGNPVAPSPRLRDLIERLDELEADVSGLRKRVMRLQGMVTGEMGGRPTKEAAQEPTGPTIERGAGVELPPRLPPMATDHLARRFRMGG